MPDSYKDAPPTIGELRSGKEWDCTKWGLRDALISALREVDNGGVDGSQAIIIYTLDDGAVRSLHCGRPRYNIGLMEQVKMLLLTDDA